MPTTLENLRAAAKHLKRACDAGEPAALARVRAHTSDHGPPRLADCLHTIAREQGHESWPKLKFAIEAAALTRDQRAERLKMALYFGQRWVVDRLLGEDPGLTDHNLGLRIATYDLPAVRAALAASPEAATRPIGVRRPILHLAFSKYIHMRPEREADMLAIADLLLAHGADPNDGYPPEPGSSHALSALYGALGHADNMALAEWLLAHGASPDDDESLYHATELGHRRGLELLIRYGVSTTGTNALPRALDFDDVEAVRLLLDHGADPNEAVTGHPSGQPVDSIPALHQAARRWCSAEMAELLLARGADPRVRWQDHDAYAMARIFGNQPVAGVLERHGHAAPLRPDEQALAAAAEGDEIARLAPGDIGGEDRQLAVLLASEPARLDHLRRLLEAGFDPNWTDSMGLTPLHAAAWAGLPDHVALLLNHDPDLAHVNGFGGTALGTCIHGAEHCPEAAGRDYIACARLLLEAGAPLSRDDGEGCGAEDLALFLDEWVGSQGKARKGP